MTAPDASSEADAPSRVSRRRLLAGGAIAGAGAAAAIGVELSASASAQDIEQPLNGEATVAFYGAHQQGIDLVPQAHQTLVALQLLPEVGRDDLVRMLGILSDDAARMSQGMYALADSEPEFASTPARLTVTFGFGPEVVRRARGEQAVPRWLGPLPPFGIDRLESRWSDGDLLLQIASDDPITLAHSTRMLLKDSRSFATVKWQQTGFRNSPGSVAPGMSMRNLFGQVDGTVNAFPGTEELAEIVWIPDDDWMTGGSTMVVRRIEMLLDKWDRLDRSGREASVGRRMDDGAPLTGEAEHDEPDFAATTPVGFPVIPEFSHVRRARDEGKQKIFRRGYNYDMGGNGSQVSNAGLIFTSFQANLYTQFLPIQQRLAELDLLNEWIVPIGSAVFVIPPGTSEGGFIGETLFD